MGCEALAPSYVVCPPVTARAGSLSRWWVARRLRRAFPVGSLYPLVAELRGACAELRSLFVSSLCVRPFRPFVWLGHK